MSALRSVLFVVPRFHTNLFFATRALVEAHVRVAIWSLETVAGEDHSFVTPTVWPRADINLADVHRRLIEIDPELILLRDVGALSKRVFLAGALQRRGMLAYDQKPYLRPRRSALAGLQSLIRGKPGRRITPVPGLRRPDRHPDPLARYIPFPVEAPREVADRVHGARGRVSILCVGKLTQPRKNHLILLDALEGLAGSFDFTATLVGSTSTEVRDGSRDHLDTITARIAAPALAGRVRIEPDVPFSRMADLYRSHDICVLPADREPLGSSPLEGMGWGAVPLISTGCGSAGYVDGTGAGFTFRPNDHGALAAALEPLLASRELLAATRRAAWSLARTELAPAAFVERLAAAARSLRA